MKRKDFKTSLLFLILAATVLGISIDIYVNSDGGNLWKGLSIFKYFTLQSNAIVMIFSFIALFNVKGLAHKESFKNLLSPITSYITLTGITYAILLEPTSTAQGLHRVATVLLHYVVPPLMCVFWLFFEERKLEYRMVAKWLIYPVLFMLWGLFLAFSLNDYLYPFFDIEKYGFFLIAYLLIMAVSVMTISLFFVFVKKRLKVNQTD